ncbi:MAG: arylsulfatase [Tannerellaceae bacterium]|nr:arylsulfatase [Tannerellaceae bacterium]
MNTLATLKNTAPLFGLASCCALASCQAGQEEKKAEAKSPNIVIILADDMGYGDVSFNNPFSRTKTPNIDRLGAEGICFTDAHAGGAVSVPSRYGLMTGRYFFRAENRPSYWGYLSPLIEPGRETIGTLMQKAGYTTACVGKWHLGMNWGRKDGTKPLIGDRRTLGYTNVDFNIPTKGGPKDVGFNYSFILPASLDMPPYTFIRDGKAIDPDVILTADMYPNTKEGTKYGWDSKHVNERDIYWDRGVWWRNGEMSKSFKVENCLDNIVDEGLAFIKRHVDRNKDKPFMLYLPLTGPHTPWMPNDVFKNSSGMGTYGDFIAQIDDVVFKVEDLLKQLGIDENTMVIFATDNGAAWQEEDKQQYGHRANGQWRGMKGDAWEGGHRAPLFIKWPAQVKKAQKYEQNVNLIDILATLADMTGQTVARKDAEDSFSFWHVLNGDLSKPTREHDIYITSSGKLAITKGDWKYIDAIGSAGFSEPSRLETVPGGPTAQLYNLAEDPAESTNRIFTDKGIADELQALMKQIVEQGHSRN